MIWLESGADLTLPLDVELALLRAAIAAEPANPAHHAGLGDALRRSGAHLAAGQAFEAALRLDPGRFRAWDKWAQCQLALNRPGAALDICERGGADPSGSLWFQRGCALRDLRRPDEARAAFERALALGDRQFDALRALLGPLAKNPDGTPLLAFCDSLESAYRDTCLIRAHRAIALSRLGRVDEARALVDLERHVHRLAFEPSVAFGDIAEFNRRLSEEILSEPGRRSSQMPFDISYEPRTENRPALSALLAFVRDSLSDYVGRLAELGLTCLLPAPATASLYAATLVLRDEGSNGEHVHRFGYVSTVYHARVPDEVARATDHRGSLVLGACDLYTGGYQPCWGKFYVRPEAGWLTLFPSHFFHDVVPSRTGDPRISVSSDLIPAGFCPTGA